MDRSEEAEFYADPANQEPQGPGRRRRTKEPPRCPWAIHFASNLHTRCHQDAGHQGNHVGKGNREFAYQRIEWLPGDRREYQTERTDEFAWERTT